MRLKISCLVLVCCLCLFIAGCGKKAESEGGAQSSPEVAELTKQVRRYSFEKRKMPESLDELVVAGYIKAVPPAPTGKKYAVDTKRAEVILVDK
jgi:competence protein ComGC